jgi:hypothetical protein
MRRALISMALLSATTIGCNSWEADSRYDYPVFSEDGEGIAAVYMNFEGQDTITHTRTRNFETQVLVKEGTGSAAPTALTSMMTGQVRDLFFMRDQGYIILGRHGDASEVSDGSSERMIWYDRIDLDGTVTRIAGGGAYRSMLSCDGGSSASSTAGPLRVIPSPDGTVLALFEATSTCEERTMTVTFLDPSDLSVIDGPIDVPDEEPTTMDGYFWWKTVDLAWTADDVFSVGFWGTGSAMDTLGSVEIAVEGDTTEDVEIPMDCFYPPTSSSSTNADGETVQISGSTGAISTSTTGTDATYGCDE